MNKGNFVERVIPGRVQYELWQEHINRYFFALRFVPSKVVLDVACGTGYGTELISKTADLAIGVDISREALTYAKKHYGKQHNIAFVLSDACNLPFRDNAFDVAVSFETIEHIDHSEIFLQQITCVLKMNGTLIVSTPNGQISSPRQETPPNPFHLKEFDIKEFTQLLSIFFTNLQFYGQCYYTMKDWLLRFLDKHSNSFRVMAKKLGSTTSKPTMPKREMTKAIDPVYHVKTFRNLYPVYTPRFFIVVATNEKR
jgi:ubiquinone/menaquinone biosynthesis C-methylase UbiE